MSPSIVIGTHTIEEDYAPRLRCSDYAPLRFQVNSAPHFLMIDEIANICRVLICLTLSLYYGVLRIGIYYGDFVTIALITDLWGSCLH